MQGIFPSLMNEWNKSIRRPLAWSVTSEFPAKMSSTAAAVTGWLRRAVTRSCKKNLSTVQKLEQVICDTVRRGYRRKQESVGRERGKTLSKGLWVRLNLCHRTLTIGYVVTCSPAEHPDSFLHIFFNSQTLRSPINSVNESSREKESEALQMTRESRKSLSSKQAVFLM